MSPYPLELGIVFDILREFRLEVLDRRAPAVYDETQTIEFLKSPTTVVAKCYMVEQV